MASVWMIARSVLRSRWRSVLSITLAVGVLGAVVLATLAGANRTGSALARFTDQSRPADIELLVPGAADSQQLDALRQAPGVADLVSLHAYGLVIPSFPQMQAISVATDEDYGTVMDRGRIIDGRAADPDAADEITVGEGLVEQLHLKVGDRLKMNTYSPEQIAAIYSGAEDVGPPAGLDVAPRIVGIDRRPLDLGDRGAAGGLLTLTPAFDRLHADDIGLFGSRLRVRTDRGAADVAGVVAQSRQIFGESLLNAQGLAIETEGAQSQIDVMVAALWILAIVIALAGGVAIGLVLRRTAARLTPDQAVLGALGMDRRQRMAVFAAPGLLIAGGGACLACVGAVALSPVFPVGVARAADPDVGVHVDWLALLAGAAVIVGLVLTILAVAAVQVTARTAEAGRVTRRGSVLVRRARSAGLPPTVTNGMRMALEPGAEGSTPVRSAYLGSILGIAGLTAVLVFVASLNHLIDTPRLYGWNWEFASADVTSNAPCGGDDWGLIQLTGVADLTELCYENVQIDGHAVTGLAYTTLKGSTIDPQLVRGRAPVGPQDVALGAKTMQRLGVHLGDTVVAAGRDDSHQGTYEVVGEVVFPMLGQPQVVADGAAFTGAGFAPLFDPNAFSRFFVGRFDPDADSASTRRDIGSIDELDETFGATVPLELDRLRQVSWLPAALALIMAGLALIAVGYSVVSGTRRRQREFAVLRVLGFRPTQVGATIRWQGATLFLIGLVVGVPLGLIAGETLWRVVVSRLGVSAPGVVPLRALLLGIPVGALIAGVMAAWPTRRVVRTRPAMVLRSE